MVVIFQLMMIFIIIIYFNSIILFGYGFVWLTTKSWKLMEMEWEKGY